MSADHTDIAGDRDVSRTLGLLEASQTGALTIAALRERGVVAPAQAVYMLHLAGYEIDRVPCENPRGNRSLGYRLRSASGRTPDRPAIERVHGDETRR